MKLINSPNRWSCLVASFAMILDSTIEQLIEEIGHDGSDIIWPVLAEPLCRRSFHIQEMIDCCYRRGFSLTPIDAMPCSLPHKYATPLIIEVSEQRLITYMNTRGVLTGITQSGCSHAIAYDGIDTIYDPVGKIYRLEQSTFIIQQYWRLTKTQSNQQLKNPWILLLT